MDFDVFGCTVRRTQGLRQVFGNQIAGNGNNRSMADCAVGINRDVGRTATDIDDTTRPNLFRLQSKQHDRLPKAEA